MPTKMATSGPANRCGAGDFFRVAAEIEMSRGRPIVGLLALLPILPAPSAAQPHETSAKARPVASLAVSHPDYLQPQTDAAFATPFIRVMDAGRKMLPGVSCKPAYCTHRYSSPKRRLVDGAFTDLAPCGEGQHVSVRNNNRPGRVFATCAGTYPGPDEQPGHTPFYHEVVALGIEAAARSDG